MNNYYSFSIEKTDGKVNVHYAIDIARESYLTTAAKYNGVSVLPGSFQIELVYEAVSNVLGMAPTKNWALRNIQFQRVPKFLKNTIRLSVELNFISSKKCLIEITSLFTDKTGRVLDKIVYSKMEFDSESNSSFLPPPEIAETESYIDPDIPTAFYSEKSPLHLGTYFNNVGETTVFGPHRRSKYELKSPLLHEAFSKHITPPLLVDAMMQNSVNRFGEFIEVGIPKSIGVIRFLEDNCNDYNLSQRYPSLLLFSTVSQGPLGAQNAWIAKRDGSVICAMGELQLTSLGFIQTSTGNLFRNLPTGDDHGRRDPQAA